MANICYSYLYTKEKNMVSQNILNFILPIFLADEDLREDIEMYDKNCEKLVIHNYCKIPVCFYSFPDKKILRNSDFRALDYGIKELYKAAINNLNKNDFFIDPYYDEYDYAKGYIAKELNSYEGFDPEKLYVCGTECTDTFGAEAILSEKFLCKIVNELKEDFYILMEGVRDIYVLPCSAVHDQNGFKNLSEHMRNAVNEKDAFFHGIFRYYKKDGKLRLISKESIYER